MHVKQSNVFSRHTYIRQLITMSDGPVPKNHSTCNGQIVKAIIL